MHWYWFRFIFSADANVNDVYAIIVIVNILSMIIQCSWKLNITLSFLEQGTGWWNRKFMIFYDYGILMVAYCIFANCLWCKHNVRRT